MGSLQKTLQQILSRMRGATLSQRIALLLGGALTAVSLLWLGNWAATPELTPLLDQDLGATEIASIRSGLEAMNEKFEVRGQRVYVRSDANRAALQAQLLQGGHMPDNTSAGFAALVRETNPLISQAESDRRWNYALQKELETVLRQLSGVRAASVLLPVTTQRTRFAKFDSPVTASVTLTMASGENVPRTLALAAARLVSGAVRGLPLKNVQVVDGNGVSALDWESDGPDGAGALNRERAAQERAVEEKLRAQLPDPKVRVSVRVELESTARNTTTETPVSGVERIEQNSSTRISRSRRGAAPGVEPNTAVTAGGSTGPDETQETETTRTEKQTGMETRREETPAGGIKEIHAAINVSASYLEAIFRRSNAADAAPNEEALKTIFEREKPRFVSQAVKLVKPQADENVAVDWYYDIVEAPATAPAGAMDQGLDALRKYGPQGGLALLALISLGLMLRLARKSGDTESFGIELGLPREAIDAARQAASDAGHAASARARTAGNTQRHVVGGGGGTAVVAAMPSGSALDGVPAMPVGTTAVTEGVLMAQEVDEGTVQTNKMIDQVAQLVDADPDNLSALFEQWVRRGDAYRSRET